MVTAAIGAAVVGHWEEGAILLGLFSTSNALEHHALGRTQRAVRALMELSPEVATVLRDSQERVIPVESCGWATSYWCGRVNGWRSTVACWSARRRSTSRRSPGVDPGQQESRRFLLRGDHQHLRRHPGAGQPPAPREHAGEDRPVRRAGASGKERDAALHRPFRGVVRGRRDRVLDACRHHSTPGVGQAWEPSIYRAITLLSSPRPARW